MMNFGYIELIIVMIVGLVGVILPAAAIVLMVLIYNKVKNIEEKVNKLVG